jgi:hypothetical protein
MTNNMNMIQIEKITKIGNRYEAIANDGKDYGSEISATILLRAAEGWNGKTKLYFNTETNKWTRVAEFPEPKTPKAAKAPKAVKSVKRAKAAKAVQSKLVVNEDGSQYEMSEMPNGGYGVVKYTAPEAE